MAVNDIDRQNVPTQDRIIPRCTVVHLGDEGTVPRFITVELPEVDRSRVLAWFNGFPNVDVGSIVELQLRGNDGLYKVINTDGDTPIKIDALKWVSPWSPDVTNQLNDVVEKDGWLMRANKETTDPPDPQLVRTLWLVPDSPSWTTNNVTDGVNTGVRIQVTGAGIFVTDKVRFWASSQSSTVEYQVLVRNNSTGQAEVYAVISGDETSAGWNVVDLGETLTLNQGDDATLWLHTVDFATTTQFVGDWDTTLSNQDITVTAGQVHRRTNRIYVWFHKTDNTSGDRSAELLSVIPGTTITSNQGANWTVVSVSDEGDYVEYDLDVTDDPTAGVNTYTFSVPISTPVDYVSLPNHWTPQPNATLSGHLILDSVGPPGTENDTAYGIDVEIREYTASPDWDFMAVSGISVGVSPSPEPVLSLASNRNHITNGDFIIDQMVTGDVIGATGKNYFGDIWALDDTAGLTYNYGITVGQLELGSTLFNSYAYLTITTGAPVGASEFTIFNTAIEGFDLLRLWSGLDPSAGQMTLSFWCLATQAGTYSVSFRNATASRSLVADFTVNTSSIWEYKTITVPRDNTFLSYNTDVDIGLNVTITVNCGATFRTATVNQWQPGNFLASNNLVDMDSSGASMFLTGVQLEPGSVGTIFNHIPYNDQLARVRRYYHKYAWPNNTAGFPIISGYADTADIDYFESYLFSNPMRKIPTLVDPNFGANWTQVNTSFFSTGSINESGFLFNIRSIGAGELYAHFVPAPTGKLPEFDARLL